MCVLAILFVFSFIHKGSQISFTTTYWMEPSGEQKDPRDDPLQGSYTMKISTHFRKRAAFRCLTLFCAAFMALTATAFAAPVQRTEQVSGFYRQQVGSMAVTALYDGYLGIGIDLLHGAGKESIQALLAGKFVVQLKDGVQTSVNAYLVDTGKHLVLVDTGAGQCFGPTAGNIGDNIKAAGYAPEDVDTVLLTHLHPDHVCGLLSKDGKAAFPNAVVWAAKEDQDFWLSKEIAAAAPEANRPFFKMTQDAVAPYAAKKALRSFTHDTEVLPGLTPVASFGHTPGHTGFLVKSGDEALFIWGDIVHSHAVQFRHPEVSFEFDSDQQQAVSTRKRIFEKAAAERWLVGGAHLPFPGLGHVRKEGTGYEWVPVEYMPYGVR